MYRARWIIETETNRIFRVKSRYYKFQGGESKSDGCTPKETSRHCPNLSTLLPFRSIQCLLSRLDNHKEEYQRGPPFTFLFPSLTHTRHISRSHLGFWESLINYKHRPDSTNLTRNARLICLEIDKMDDPIRTNLSQSLGYTVYMKKGKNPTWSLSWP